MAELDQCFCPNEKCKDFGLRHQGNIAIRGKYGKDKSRDLLYCRTCGKRFGATQASALFGLHLPPETIRQIIHHAAEGVGVRATARLLELDKDTVNRVILRSNSHFAPKRAILNGIEGFTGSIGGSVTHICGAFSARRAPASCFLGLLGSFRAH